MVGTDLPDGRHAYYGGPGPEPGWYLKHIVDGRQVWDQPIDLDDYLDEDTVQEETCDGREIDQDQASAP